MTKNKRPTTRNLKIEQKESLYKSNETLLNAIYYFGNGIVLKEQLITIMSLIEPLNKGIEDKIKILVDKGFLGEKNVLTSNKCSVYLTKYPQSKIEGKKSRDVTSVKPTTEKVLNSLLRVEYVIINIIKNGFQNKEPKEIVEKLNNNCITVLLEKHNVADCYTLLDNRFNSILEDEEIERTFLIDRNVAYLNKLIFNNKLAKVPQDIPEHYIKALNELNNSKLTIDNKSTTEERDFFNLQNMLHRGFGIRQVKKINKESGDELHISCFFLDYNNSIHVDKLYKNIGYLYRMFTRYTTLKVILIVRVYGWSKARANQLDIELNEKVKDFGLNNYKKYTKGPNALLNGGVEDGELKNIVVNFDTLNITDKYNIKK